MMVIKPFFAYLKGLLDTTMQPTIHVLAGLPAI